MLPRGSMNEK